MTNSKDFSHKVNQTIDFFSNEEIEEMTVYNKKLRCFMTKERKDDEIKN